MAQQAGHMTTSFACGMCGRCFRLADECMEHIRGHTANKHFRCLVCWPLFSDITDSEPPPSRGISQSLASDVQPQPTTDRWQHSGCNNCGDCHSCSTGYEGKTQLVKDDWDTQAHELSVTMQIESCHQTPPQFSLENGERLILDKHSTNLACDTDMDSSDGSAAGGQKKGQPKRMVHTELTKISHDELTRSAHDELTGAIHDELTASTRDKLVASTGDKLVTSPCDLSASTGDKLGCVPVSNWSSTIPSVDDKEQWCSRHGELTETHDTVNDRETITNNKDTVTNDGEPTTNDKGITINDIDTTATTTVQQVEVSGDVADKVADLVSMQEEVCDLHSVAQSLLSLAQEELPPSRSNTDGESKETGAGSEDSVRCGTGTVPGESSQSSADGTPPVIRVKTSSKGPNFTNVIKFLKYVSVRKGITPTQNIQTDHSDVVEKCSELQTGTENLAAGRGDGESPSNPHATILRKLVCSGQNAAQSCEENPRVRAILYVPASLQPPAEMGTGSWELHSETTVRIESQETDSVSVRTVPQGTGHTVCQTAANADGDDSVRHTGTNNKDSGGESSQHASQDDDGADDDTGHRDETSSIGVRDPASVDGDKDGQRSSLLCSGLNQVGDSIGGPISSGCVSSNASHSVSVPDHDYSTVHRDFRRNSVHGYTALRSNTETNSAQKGVALQAETLTEAEMEKERMLQCVDLYPRKKKNPEPSSTSGAAATCLQARPDENTNTKRTTKSSGAKRGTRRKGQPSKRKKDQRQTGVTDSAGVPTVDHRQDPSTLTVRGSSSVCGTSVENLTNTGSTSQHPDTQAVLKSNQPVHIPEASAEDNQPAGCRENTEILSTLAEPAVADSVITGCGQTDSLAVEHAVGSGQDRKAMDVVILPTHFDSADQAKGVNSDTGGGRREVEQSAVVNTVEDTSAADVDDLSASAGSFDVPVKDVPARDSKQPDNREPVTLDREPVTDEGHDPSQSHREREGQRHVVVTQLPSRLTGKGSTRKRQADESLVAMSVGQILLSDIQSASKRRLRSSMTHVNPHQPSKPDRASSERTGPKGKVTDTVSACETTTVMHSSSQKEELAQLELENEGPLCLTLRHSHQQETLSSTRLSTSTPQTKEQRRLKVKLPFMDRKSGSGKKQVKKSGFSEEKSHSSRGEERQVLSLSKSQTIENRQSLRHRSSVSPDPCSNRGHVKSELMRLGENMALDVLAEIGCANDTVVEGTGENKTDISRGDVLYRRDNPLREDLSDTRAVSIGDNRHYDCKKCGAQFRHKLSLMSHMTVHQSIGSDCVCDVCGRTFTRPYSVKIHRMIHTKEASIDCKICGKTLANPVNLQIHMRIHTDERPYTCSECPKTFRQQAALYSHQRTHSKERPYACEYCGKSYAFQKNLYTHRFSHTGQRPYVCKICGAGFRQMTALNVHIRGHTGEKPFKCPECPSAFAQKSHLKKHVQHRHQPKVESAEKVAADKAKPYRCIQCDKGFCSPFSVRRHMNGYCTEDKNYVAHTKSHA